jgi:hypothetical protein
MITSHAALIESILPVQGGFPNERVAAMALLVIAGVRRTR